MPAAAGPGHVSMPEKSQQSPPMPTPYQPREAAVLRKHNPAPLYPTGNEALGPRRGGTRTLDRRHSFDYLWRSGVAGGVAGCSAKSLVAPLDRVKILFQSHNPQFVKYAGSWVGVAKALQEIHAQEGPAGLFRGHSATLLRIFPYAAIKFLAYEQIRAVVVLSKQHETPVRRFLSGGLAGVTSVLFTYPLEVIRVRLAFETKRVGRSSMRSLVASIYHEQPPTIRAPTTTPPPSPKLTSPYPRTSPRTPGGSVANFYRGFTPTLLGMIPYAGMSFLTHDTVSDLLRRPSLSHLTTAAAKPPSLPAGKPPPLLGWAELLAGGVAGMVSQTASYPIEVMRRRMQVGGAVGDGHKMRVAETAIMIFKEGGVRGFFVGLTIGYAKVVPMAAVSFWTYERMKIWLSI